jgi:Transmembrane protein 43
MSDTFTTRSYTGFGGNLLNSFKGILVGIVMVLISVGVLFWNEGRNAKRLADLGEVQGKFVKAGVGSVESGNEGKAVYLSGKATSEGTLKDPQFGISVAGALKLARNVEMYQWKEKRETKTEKKLGGGEEKVTTFTYVKGWFDEPLDSSEYNQPSYANPKTMPFPTLRLRASDAKLGAFGVGDDVLDALPTDTLVSVDPAVLPDSLNKAAVQNVSATQPAQMVRPVVRQDEVYFGNPDSPQIGDARVNFRQLPSGPVSVVARQAGNRLEPYITRGGREFLLAEVGEVSPELLFKHAYDENKMITWIIRGAGFLFLTIGFSLMMGPITAIANVVPFLGSIVGFGTLLVGLVLAIFTWCVTVGLAWLFYRPVIGVTLLVLGVGIPMLIAFLRKPKAPPQAIGA